jgi:hypothetical protein
MFSRLSGFLKKLFIGTTPPPEAVPEEKPPFRIEHEWPFPSPQPTNEEYLVGELIKGVEPEGEHVFFFWDGQKRRHLRTTQGRETVLARNVIWWMEGRKVPSTAAGTGLTTNCGEPKCIKLSHLTLKTFSKPYGPERNPNPQHVVHKVPKAKQPPLPPKVRPGQKTPLVKFSYESRNKCITRKVYFETEAKAVVQARIQNHPSVRGHGQRQHPYLCTQCDGWHLSKTDPKKFGKKKVGSW